jgi:hypothetical protein
MVAFSRSALNFWISVLASSKTTLKLRARLVGCLEFCFEIGDCPFEFRHPRSRFSDLFVSYPVIPLHLH